MQPDAFHATGTITDYRPPLFFVTWANGRVERFNLKELKPWIQTSRLTFSGLEANGEKPFRASEKLPPSPAASPHLPSELFYRLKTARDGETALLVDGFGYFPRSDLDLLADPAHAAWREAEDIVTEASFVNNSLDGIPQALKALTVLRRLQCGFNNISDVSALFDDNYLALAAPSEDDDSETETARRDPPRHGFAALEYCCLKGNQISCQSFLLPDPGGNPPLAGHKAKVPHKELWWPPNLSNLDLSLNKTLTCLPSVTFTKAGSLTVLKLNECGLERLPSSLWGISNLEHLEARGNMLQHLDDLDVYGTPVPTKVGTLGKLKHLDLSSNDLAPSLALFATLLILPVQFLDLTGNARLLVDNSEEEQSKASNATTPQLRAQESLTNLNLKRTGASKFPAVMLRGAGDLSSSSLATRATGVGSSAHYSAASTLSASTMASPSKDPRKTVEATSPLTPSSPSSLQCPNASDEVESIWAFMTVDLSYNNLKTIPALFFSLSAALTALDLSHNELAALPASMFSCRKLKRLNLEHNRLRSLPVSVRGLVSLEDLALGWNALTSLPELPTSMRVLTAGFNDLVSLPRSISSLKNLELVQVNNNPRLEWPPRNVFTQGNRALLRFLGVGRGAAAPPPFQLRDTRVRRLAHGLVAEDEAQLEEDQQEPGESVAPRIKKPPINASKEEVLVFDQYGDELTELTKKGYMARSFHLHYDDVFRVIPEAELKQRGIS